MWRTPWVWIEHIWCACIKCTVPPLWWCAARVRHGLHARAKGRCFPTPTSSCPTIRRTRLRSIRQTAYRCSSPIAGPAPLPRPTRAGAAWRRVFPRWRCDGSRRNSAAGQPIFSRPSDPPSGPAVTRLVGTCARTSRRQDFPGCGSRDGSSVRRVHPTRIRRCRAFRRSGAPTTGSSTAGRQRATSSSGRVCRGVRCTSRNFAPRATPTRSARIAVTDLVRAVWLAPSGHGTTFDFDPSHRLRADRHAR